MAATHAVTMEAGELVEKKLEVGKRKTIIIYLWAL